MSKKAMNRIKVVLVEKNKSQVWLAGQLGKSKYTVSRWCTNNVQPPLDVMFEIAKLLGVKVRDLIIEDE